MKKVVLWLMLSLALFSFASCDDNSSITKNPENKNTVTGQTTGSPTESVPMGGTTEGQSPASDLSDLISDLLTGSPESPESPVSPISPDLDPTTDPAPTRSPETGDGVLTGGEDLLPGNGGDATDVLPDTL